MVEAKANECTYRGDIVEGKPPSGQEIYPVCNLLRYYARYLDGIETETAVCKLARTPVMGCPIFNYHNYCSFRTRNFDSVLNDYRKEVVRQKKSALKG